MGAVCSTSVYVDTRVLQDSRNRERREYTEGRYSRTESCGTLTQRNSFLTRPAVGIFFGVYVTGDL